MDNVSFFPWLKRGIGAFVQPPAAGARRAVVKVKLTLEAEPKPTPAPAPTETTVALELIGPGDIASLDTRVITRTWPKPDVTDVETAFFPLVEFGEADLPWRYTPDRATVPDPNGQGGDILEPWLVLAVLNDDEWQPVAPATAADRTALPAIRVTNVGALPPLSESWAWAHIQVAGNVSATDLPGILTSQPERAVSRIFCPRRLAPNKPYTAFLVPAFAAGVQAGLGQPVSAHALGPAWVSDTAPLPGEVTLPVYHQWRFHTGEAGSFKDLAKRLSPRVLAEAAFRSMDVTSPGMGLTDRPTRAPVPVEGALRPLGASIPPWPDSERTELSGQLRPKLNAPADALDADTGRPVLGPPLYGQWHAARQRVGQAGSPVWFEDLNITPQLRVVAAVGTEVVQKEQQALLASAWNQVDDLRQVNQQIKEAQLAREASSRLFTRNFESIPRFEQLFQIASSVVSRVLAQAAVGDTPAQTVRGALDQSPIPVDILGGAWRRLGSPLGLVGRRQGRPGKPLPPVGKTLIETTNAGTISPAPTPSVPSGAATPGRVGAGLAPECLTPQKLDALAQVAPSDLLFWALVFFFVGRSMAGARSHFWLSRGLLRLALRLVEASATTNGLDGLRADVAAQTGTITPGQVTGAPPIDGFQPVEPPPLDAGDQPPPPIPPPGNPDTPELAAFRAAAAGLLQHLAIAPEPGPQELEVDLTDLASKLLGGLEPGLNINPLGRGKFQIPESLWKPADALEPVMAAPVFPQPMYEPLREVSLEWVLPGISAVPADTVALLETNQKFIEAYMAGLNHEMSRELLWNEYPTDQRGTYFRKFWDTRGFVTAGTSEPDPETQKDIQLMHGWTGALGNHSARVPREQLVLFLRGEILRRYPALVVYIAQAAGTPRRPGTVEEYPVFSGNLGSDTGFYGFTRVPADIAGSPGWYFVLQEPPGETRFGWQKATEAPPVEGIARFGIAGPHFSVDTAADAACAALVTPTRVAIFGTAMLP